MLLTALLLACSAPFTSVGGDDWPHLRGPGLDGQVASNVFERPTFGLRSAWRVPLGPAYSGVAVADGRLVTMFSDGASDWVVALDVLDGHELWRHELGATYLGHDGSDDGPISSPVIAGGTVHAVGPRGVLLALALEDGAVRWSADLVADHGATQPDYGFTTTPLVEGKLVIVQVGGSEGRLLVAFDRASGAVVWSAGEGAAGYTSPFAMDLAGERQVIALNGPELLGVAPASGAVLWKLALGEQSFAGSGLAGAIDGETFYADVGSGLALFHAAKTEVGYAVEERARTRDLGDTYAAPVLHDGHLYGFKSDFLTCIEVATQKRVWRSRPPGGKGLILVGHHLVVFGADGVVAIVRATPDGYREKARFAALGHSSFTWPAFAGGRVFLRNNAELTCVEVVDAAEPTAAAPTPSVPPTSATAGRGDFEAFLAAMVTVGDKRAAVEALLVTTEQFPIVEGDQVHFVFVAGNEHFPPVEDPRWSSVFRGAVEDVAIAGLMVPGGSEALRRLQGTDLFYRTYTIEPGGRFEYRFQVNYEQWLADPLNPRRVPGVWGGELSEVLAEGYQEETHFREPAGVERGRIESYEFASALLGDARAVSIYLPAGYDASAASYPLLIVQRGPDYLEQAQLAHTLDNLIGTRVRPLVAVFVTPTDQWWHESGGTGTEEYLEMLAREFVPDLAARYRLLDGPENRALLAQEHFALSAAFGALLYPDVFGQAALQSAALGDIARHALFELIESDPLEPVAFHVEWNRYEARDGDGGYDRAADSRRLSEALRERGYRVTGGEILDTAGWAAWRARSDDLLEELFPLE
jgi:outer membrane protein assembly factor BamB